MVGAEDFCDVDGVRALLVRLVVGVGVPGYLVRLAFVVTYKTG